MENKDIKKSIIIGYVRDRNPNDSDIVMAINIRYLGCNFIYFKPSGIDIENKKINGYVYKSTKWEEYQCNFPTIVDNDDNFLSSEIGYSLCFENNIPYTYYPLINDKFKNYSILSKNESLFPHIVSFVKKYDNIDSILEFILNNKNVIIKNKKSNNNYFINNHIIVNNENNISISENNKSFINFTFRNFKYKINQLDLGNIFIQKYIDSKIYNIDNILRVHICRSYNAEWKIVDSYFRFNLFPKKYCINRDIYSFTNKIIIRNIYSTAMSIANILQNNYNEHKINTLYIDFAINSNEQYYIINVKSIPVDDNFNNNFYISISQYNCWFAFNHIKHINYNE